MLSRIAFPRLTALALLVAGLVLALGHAPVAHADVDTGSVQLDQPAYTAHEDQGSLTITIVRSGDLSAPEHVGYGVKRQDAQPGIDFDIVENHYITIPAGQQTYAFSVPIIDRGMNGPPVHALAYLYSAWPQPLGANNNSLVTILRDDPLQPRDDANPLGVATPVPGDPLVGTKFYVDPDSGPIQAARHSSPANRGLLDEIGAVPGAHRFYMWNMGSSVAGQVAHYLEGTQVQQPGTTVMLSTYNLVHAHCGYTATPAIEARYDNFMQDVARGIGDFHVVFFLELDSLITSPCLTRAQLAIRDAELRYAIGALEADPHTVVYMDGGAADALGWRKMADRLRGAGVAEANGFFLNSTHFDWTTKEIHYGQEISRRLGGTHFIVNTGGNGLGPKIPVDRVRYGNEDLCNPPGRGLGPLSIIGDVAQPTAYADVDGLLWMSTPGVSGGACVPGAPAGGVFWPAYAEMLARNWVHQVSGPAFDLLRSPFAGEARLAGADDAGAGIPRGGSGHRRHRPRHGGHSGGHRRRHHHGHHQH